MRAMWSGTITFGMVSVPVKMYKATDSDGTGLNLLCKCHQQQIKKPDLCAVDGHKLESTEKVRAVRRPEGWVILEDVDLQNLPLKTMHSIDIEAFVPTTQIPIEMLATGLYYLEPQAPNKGILDPDAYGKPYAIFRDALAESGTYGIAKLGMRDRERLVALSVHSNAICLTEMVWPTRVRTTAELKLPVKAALAEIAMWKATIDTWRNDWEPENYQDLYKPALDQLIDSKVTGVAIPVQTKPAPPAQDLVSQLKATMAMAGKKQAKKRRAS